MPLKASISDTRGPTPRTYITGVSRPGTLRMLKHLPPMRVSHHDSGAPPSAAFLSLRLRWDIYSFIFLTLIVPAAQSPANPQKETPMPTAASIMADLNSKGKEQTRKIYARHGTDPD